MRGPGSGRLPDLAAADAVDDRADVVGRGAAAAAHDADAVALDELLEGVRQRLGLLGEDRLAVRALERDAGVGDAVHRHRAVIAQVADRVAHVLGSGRAVQPDHVHVERGEGGEHRLDVGAEQHLAAVGQQRDRALERQRLAGRLERLAGAEDRGLDLQDVLRGLDDDQVRAAVDQALGLLSEDLDQLGEGDLAQGGVVGGGQVPGRADRAGHEPLIAHGLACDLGGLLVDLQRVVGQAPLLELDPAGLEGVCLDHLGPRFDHRGVDALDHVGAVQDKRLVALALEAHVVLLRQVELLEGRAHAAVEDDDPGVDRG